jgi:flavin-dependent dehydrogenase
MDFDYDVVIIGGGFSGAATALMIKRKHPAARVLIIEKNAAFDRKVGKSTRYSARVQTFQVDRAKLDSHLLQCAVDAGCELLRPAKVTKIDLNGANGQTVDVDLTNGGRRAVGAENMMASSRIFA